MHFSFIKFQTGLGLQKYFFMADSYSQIHLQFVFAVKYRKALIDKEWKERLHEYITGIVQNNRHKMLQINSMPDHIHILMGAKPTVSLSDLIREIKSCSSRWINENYIRDQHFAWQDGFGAFTVSKGIIPVVYNYIANQQKHHRSRSFENEYITLMKYNEVDFEERYLFG